MMNKKEQIQAYKIILAVGQIMLFISGLLLEDYVYVIIGFFFLGSGTAVLFSAKKEKKEIEIKDVDSTSSVNINVKENTISLKKRFVDWLHT